MVPLLFAAADDAREPPFPDAVNLFSVISGSRTTSARPSPPPFVGPPRPRPQRLQQTPNLLVSPYQGPAVTPSGVRSVFADLPGMMIPV
jgi:hypothetical protein